MSETTTTLIIWLVLIALTLLGYQMGQMEMSGTVAVAILLGAAFIKGQLIISYFMEMKYADTRWRWVPTLWLVLVLTAIAIAL